MKRLLQMLRGLILLALIQGGAAFGIDPNMAAKVLDEINLSRTDPAQYAELVRQFRTRFTGKAYSIPGEDTMVITKEGTKAVDEAIEFLERQKPLKPLGRSNGLATAAAELVRDQARSGQIGHRSVRSRIEHHGQWTGLIGESIGYGPEDARSMVMQLIIDDGVPDRGHRHNNYNPDFTVAGASCGPHPRFGTMCVIEFAAGYRDKRVKE